MNVFKILGLARELYEKYQAAPAPTKAPVSLALREAHRTGAMPLGLHLDHAGEWEYLWLVFRHDGFATTEELQEYLRHRSPPNIRVRPLYI